tara:strand:- start:532 stop:2532 length:2001 start_codon:yes stop_codon:yes gene_type:complete
MANGYGSSSSTKKSKINSKGQVAPIGYHYMPSGKLMSDVEHDRLYNTPKVLTNLSIDTSNLKSIGEGRELIISGERDASFRLEITNEDNKYYNFQTRQFQTNSTVFKGTLTHSGTASLLVKFPKVSDADRYDIFFFAEKNTKHGSYREVRFPDGTIDINSSSGSNSLLLKKIIYQTLPVTLTLNVLTPNTVATFSGTTASTWTLDTTMGQNLPKMAFSLPISGGSTHSLKILRTPIASDLLSKVSKTVGSAPVDIPGENIYPAERAAFTGDDVNGAITSGAVVRMDNTDLSAVIEVGDKITSPVTTDTVDGAVTSGVRIVMDNNVATKMAVGDQVTHSSSKHFFNTNLVTVTHLNPDGDNAKEFQIDAIIQSADIGGVLDGATLTFSSKVNRNLTTVTVVETSGVATDFTMSRDDVQLRDDQPLVFSPRKNYMWDMVDVNGLAAGAIPIAGNITSGSVVSNYYDVTTIMVGELAERKVESTSRRATDVIKTTTSRNTTTNILTTTQVGTLVFNKQQKLALAGDAVVFHAYGKPAVSGMTGWDIDVSDIEITLTKPTAVTTSAVTASASVPIDNADGVMDDVSTVGSPNMAVGVANPTVTNIASYSGSTATLTLSAAQTLDDGETLTFDGAGRTVTVTGNIKVNKAGQEDVTVYFDLEKFLTATDES